MPGPLTAPDDATEQDKLDKNRRRDEETRVRETILRVIGTHLDRSRAADSGWHQNDFDFTGAELPAVQMSSIRLEGRFDASEATFSGAVLFVDARFDGPARFHGAMFSEETWFTWATFSGGAYGGADFDGATFSGDAKFDGATFSGDTTFDGATFSGDTDFDGATFSGNATFDGATFTKTPSVERGTISGRLIRTDGAGEEASRPGEERPFQPSVVPWS